MPALKLARRDPRAVEQRDPAVFAPQAGRCYELIAHTAWVEVQLAALDITEATTEAHSLSGRLQAGVLWFREHGVSSPQYATAKRLRGTLDSRLDALLLQLRITTVACWWNCCVTYAALCHVADRARWLVDVAANRFDGTSPHGIWHAVLPTMQPAGSWPIEAEGWIERRVGFVESWNLDDLHIRLAQRAKAGPVDIAALMKGRAA